MLARKCLLTVLAIVLAGPALSRASAQEAPPAVVVRVRSLDAVIDNVKLLVSLAGREEAAKQIEGLIKTKIGPKGLEGADQTRPFGGYVRFGKDIDDVTGVFLLPIADEKAFLNLLDNLNVQYQKGKNGVYSVDVDVPKGPRIPIYFRFANKYLYVAALKDRPLEGDTLPDPVKLLGGNKAAALSATIRIDQLPEAARLLAQSQIEAKLQDAEDKGPPNETAAQKTFRVASLREMAKMLVGVIKQGSEVTADLDLDKTKNEFSIDLSLNGMPKSDLAKRIEELAGSKSLFAGLKTKDAALFAGGHALLPQEMRNALGKVVDEAMAKALSTIQDETKKKQAEAIFKALLPTFKAGDMDGAVALSGPNDSKTFSLIAAGKLREGDKLSKTLRDLASDVLKDLPERERDKLKLDFDSAGSVKIHRIELDARAQEEKNWKKLIDDPYIYVAFRDDAIFVAAGKDGLKTLKAAVAAEKAAASPVFAFDVDLSRLAPVLDDPALAKRIFKTPQDGKLTVRVEAGERLNLRIQGSLAIVQYFSQLKSARVEE